MKFKVIDFKDGDDVKYMVLNTNYNFLEIGLFILAVKYFLLKKHSSMFHCPYAIHRGTIYPIINEAELVSFTIENTPLPLASIENMMEVYYGFFEQLHTH